MALVKRGRYWWYEFQKNGQRIQGSTGATERQEAMAVYERVKKERTGEGLRPRFPDTDPAVYFLRAATLGLVKIGCSGNASVRIEDLRGLNADELILMGRINTPKFREAESVLHDIFAKHRVRGEWFKITADDVDFAMRYWDRIKDSSDILDRHSTLPVDREKLYTVQEIAVMFACSASTVRNFIRAGQLLKVKYGNAVRVTGSSIEEFLELHTQPRVVKNAVSTPCEPAMEHPEGCSAND